MYLDIINKLKLKGIKFDKGLTGNEIKIIEERYNIIFPKSLVEFYKLGLPISDGFVNWRDESNENIEKIKQKLSRPYDGILWAIKENNFWVDNWDKPKTFAEQKEKFLEEMKNEPKPIPVYIFRYILSKDGIEDPAVLSMHNSDIIVYGNNLDEYFDNEFFLEHNEKHKCEYSEYMGKWIDIMESY